MFKSFFSKNEFPKDVEIPDTSWASERINQRVKDVSELSSVRETYTPVSVGNLNKN